MPGQTKESKSGKSREYTGAYVFTNLPLYDPDVANPAIPIEQNMVGLCPMAWLENRLAYLSEKWRMNVLDTDMNEKLLLEGEVRRRVEHKHRQST